MSARKKLTPMAKLRAENIRLRLLLNEGTDSGSHLWRENERLKAEQATRLKGAVSMETMALRVEVAHLQGLLNALGAPKAADIRDNLQRAAAYLQDSFGFVDAAIDALPRSNWEPPSEVEKRYTIR